VLWRLRDRMDIELVRIGSAGAKAMAVVSGDVGRLRATPAGQWEWDSAAPAELLQAAGLHASRLDGSPLIYNRRDLVPARPADVSRRGWPMTCSTASVPEANTLEFETMQSWPAPNVPALPGRGPQLRPT